MTMRFDKNDLLLGGRLAQFVWLATAVWIACAGSPTTTPATQIPVEPGTGHEWIEWDRDTRSVLVYSYTSGYYRGSAQACVIADALVPAGTKIQDLDETVMKRCIAMRRKFTKPVDYYVDTLTRFYTKYPEDRNVPASYVLPMLSDQDPKPIEEIHTLVQSGSLFLRP